MEKKSRLRGPNFTNSDSLLLCDIITKYKHVIENKKTDGANLLQKQKAWSNVMEEFNATTIGHHRTVESLQQNYKNLKKKAKKSASDAKMDIPVDRSSLVQNIEEYGTSSFIIFIEVSRSKRKLETQLPEKQSVSEKFKVLAVEKAELVALQKELLKIQLLEEQERLEHNRLLRAMEMEDAKDKYVHNDKLRQLELEKIMSNKQT